MWNADDGALPTPSEQKVLNKAFPKIDAQSKQRYLNQTGEKTSQADRIVCTLETPRIGDRKLLQCHFLRLSPQGSYEVVDTREIDLFASAHPMLDIVLPKQTNVKYNWRFFSGIDKHVNRLLSNDRFTVDIQPSPLVKKK